MKKIISLLLSVIMLCSVVYVVPFSAFAKESDVAQSSLQPVITVESVKLNPYMGSYGEIVLKVTGATNVTYQWQAGYYDSVLAPVDLDDNDYYIGTKTNHFKILASGQLDDLEFRCKITYDGGSTYSQIFHFTFLDPKVISRAYVVGVDAPAFGCCPKYATDEILSKQYDLDSMVWYGPINDSSAPEMKSTDVYLEGKYKCRFYLDPAQGYTFNENSDCSVDGIICNVYSEKRDDGTTAYYADRVYTVAYKGTVPEGILAFEWKNPSDTAPTVNLGNAYLGTDSMDIPFEFKIKALPRNMAIADYTVYGSTYIQVDGKGVYYTHTGDRVNLKDVATVPGRYYIYHELFLLDPEGNEIATESVCYLVNVYTPIFIMDLSVEIDEPVAGLDAEIAFLNKTEGCVVDNMYWYDITDGKHIELSESDVFEKGHTYQAEVWVKANEGCFFRTDSDGILSINARINGEDAEVLLASSDKVAGFTLDFTIPNDDFMLGDVDGDSKVSVMDATAVQRHVAQLATIPEDRLVCADTDKDGKVSVMDATMIQRFVAQLSPSL